MPGSLAVLHIYIFSPIAPIAKKNFDQIGTIKKSTEAVCLSSCLCSGKSIAHTTSSYARSKIIVFPPLASLSCTNAQTIRICFMQTCSEIGLGAYGGREELPSEAIMHVVVAQSMHDNNGSIHLLQASSGYEWSRIRREKEEDEEEAKKRGMEVKSSREKHIYSKAFVNAKSNIRIGIYIDIRV